MWKQKAAAVLVCGLLLGLGRPILAGETAPRFEQPDFDLPCKAAILISQDTGEILYEKNADQQLPIASITKVMTLLLTFEAIDQGKVSTGDLVPVSEHAYSMGGSQIWLEPGEQMTLDEMIRAICVASANDAAVAVAEFIGGSEPAFAAQMNQKAAELGMTNTTFKNACGLDEEGHLSTARDVAAMSRAILNEHPDITQYTTIWMNTLRGGETQLVNTNRLLQRYNGITGLKTGTTGGAGVCITASAERDGLRLIAVVLGAASSAERFDAATALLDYGFSTFEMAACPTPENAPQSLPVTGGVAEQTALSWPQLPGVLVKRGEGGGLSARFELPESLSAPVQKGQEVGWLILDGAGGELGRWPITAADEVGGRTFGYILELLVRNLIVL